MSFTDALLGMICLWFFVALVLMARLARVLQDLVHLFAHEIMKGETLGETEE